MVPDPDFLPIWAKKKGFAGSFSELCNNKVRVTTSTRRTSRISIVLDINLDTCDVPDLHIIQCSGGRLCCLKVHD